MILCVIQARMSSTRLPGKVLMPVGKNPMLLCMVERLERTRSIDGLVVATSDQASDDPVRDLCSEHGIDYYRGSLEDVLDRYYKISLIYKTASDIVRLTGDCPLIEPSHVDEVVKHHVKGKYDCTRDYNFPDGWDTEVVTRAALARVWKDATDPYDREHVMTYFYRHPGLFKLGRYESRIDYSQIKTSVDTKEDYDRVCRIASQNRRSCLSER